MVSTLLNYRLYADDMAKSLERIEASGRVSKDTAYYKANIGKVDSVDAFMADNRLYAYAMKAYGLEDQVPAKAFMRKVLQSDLADPRSFANTLADDRYRKFAGAFDFRASAAVPAIQGTAQTEALIGAYSEQRVRAGVSLGQASALYEARIAAVRTVDEFMADDALLPLALRSVGADPASVSPALVRGALTGTATDDPGDPADDRLFVLAERFNFRPDGSLAAGTPAQDATAVDALLYDYTRSVGAAATAPAAARETRYFQNAMATLGDADDLVNDPRLFSFVMTAFGFDPRVEVPSFARNILASDPADPSGALSQLPADSPAARLRKERFTALADAFGFAADGSVPPGEAITRGAADALVEGYYARYQDAAKAREVLATGTFRFRLSTMTSLTDLLARDPVFGRDALTYALEAFDIDPATEGLAKLRRVFQSDASDPSSYVNRLKDERYEKLAAAFNFDGTGAARAERQVQSTAAKTATGRNYAATFGTSQSDARKAVVRSDTRAYLEGVADLRTLDDLLGDTKVLSYVLKAYGLSDPAPTKAQLRKILTSDLADKGSYVYTLKDERYRTFAGAFNFKPDGTVSAEPDGVQRAGDRLSTQNLYLLQTLEESAGEKSEGTRLALYFLRKAPGLTSALSILADKALLQVARTAFGLPASFSSLDIDKQAAILEKRVKVSDFSNPKTLDKFITRFAALYDVDNPATGSSAPILQLFGDGSGNPVGITGLF